MPPADNLAQWPDYEPDTLAGRIAKNGRIPPDEVLDAMKKILTIIGELHEAGLAHCDVKPENILFLDGEPRLADYSLLSDTLNRPIDPPFGTVGFIPPEMLARPDAFDPKACDLYAAGKTLYCAWSGMEAMLFPSVPKEIPLQEIGAMLPVYMKACSGSPNRRFRNAGEFLSAVDDARARLCGRAPARWKGAFGKRLLIVLSAMFPASCLTAAFFLFPRPAQKPDPLVVTTVLDVADENDGAVSFSEALAYAQAPGGIRTIRFNMKDGDEVVLRDPALVTSRMRFATTNEATGNPVNIVLDNLEISGREKSTPETTETEGGGAVLRATAGRFSVRGGRFTENRDNGSGGRGGAIHMTNGSLTVDGADFRNNAALSSGGAIYIERTDMTIRDSSFTENCVCGFGGAILLCACPEVRIVNTEFSENKTESNPYYRWSGGAIKAERSSLIYEVSDGIITNIGNESGAGGFLSLSVTKNVFPQTASAEFRIGADGILLIGDGNGMDSFASTVGENVSSCEIFIRKTGKGLMSIHAPVSDYDGKWIIVDGELVFSYAGGGDFDGEIVIAGGRMWLDYPYTFKRLTFRLGSEINSHAYINDLSRLTGGVFRIDATDAAEGTYQLADGANGFDGTVSLQHADGELPAPLAVGGTVRAGDSDYALQLSGGRLTLTVRKTDDR